MSGDWKSGDVAVRVGRFDERLTFAVDGCGNEYHAPVLHWHHADGGWDELVSDQTSYRPLVVIDPEDAEQVERLLESLRGMSFAAHACGALTCLQAVLREFARPTPPKVDEPQKLGAIVEACVAIEGEPKRGPYTFALAEDGSWICLTDGHSGRPGWLWPFLVDVEVLSEGVPS